MIQKNESRTFIGSKQVDQMRSGVADTVADTSTGDMLVRSSKSCCFLFSYQS
jgi:hypothetical protein